MKQKATIFLFGLCFLIAILGEAYLLNMANPHLFSIIGIGIVVLLTGYLWIDSIWEYISRSITKNKLLYEEGQKQETEKWDARYTELLNIQKATYAALKKSDIRVQRGLKRLSYRIEALEKNVGATDQINDQLSKVMKGQKNALNILVKYSNENTKDLIEAIKEECEGINYETQLSSIISLLNGSASSLDTNEFLDTYGNLKDKEANIDEEKAESESTPLYDDPNAALSADEIAQLFNNYGV